MRNKKWLQIMILAGVVAVALFTIYTSLPNKEERIPVVGDKIPDVMLYSTDGEAYRISDFKGQTVMINFWGTFCPPCVRETPAIQNQFEIWEDKGFTVLGINLGETKVRVDSFARQFDVTYPIVVDEKLKYAKRLGVREYPTTFIVSEDGRIVEKLVGEMYEDTIERMIEKHLPSSS